MLSLPCLCLDPHAYVQIYVSLGLCYAYAQICVFMCYVPYLCAQIYMLVAMPCASIVLLSLDITLSCALTLIGGVQIQIPWSRPTSTHLGLYQRVWIISLYSCVCLLASMLYVHAYLSRSRTCHALCPSWACSYMVTSISLMAYWGLTTCLTHPRDVGLLDAYPFSTPCDVTCHAYFVPPVQLSLLLCILFACLPTCSCMILCLHVPSILQSNGTMDTRSKPTFVFLGHLLFDNMLVCPFICLACFVCPCLALFVSMFFACSPYLLYFFLCLSAGLSPCLLHAHTWSKDAWSEGTTSQAQAKRARM